MRNMRAMKRYHNYRLPAWAEGIIKIIQYYGKEVRFISVAAERDIQKLFTIFRTHQLNFWSRVFEEYRLMYKRL